MSKRRTLTVSLVATVAAAILAIDPIASWLVAAGLQRRGILCDEESFAVTVQLLSPSATLEPTRCTLEKRPELSFALLAPVEISLGASAQAVHALAITLTVQQAPSATSAPPTTSDRLLTALQIPARIRALAGAIAGISSLPLPALHIEQLVLQQDPGLTMTLHGLHIDQGIPKNVRIEHVEVPLLDGAFGTSASVGLRETTGEASPGRLRLDSQLTASASLLVVGELAREGPIWVEVSGLDTSHPTYHFGFE